MMIRYKLNTQEFEFAIKKYQELSIEEYSRLFWKWVNTDVVQQFIVEKGTEISYLQEAEKENYKSYKMNCREGVYTPVQPPLHSINFVETFLMPLMDKDISTDDTKVSKEAFLGRYWGFLENISESTMEEIRKEWPRIPKPVSYTHLTLPTILRV